VKQNNVKLFPTGRDAVTDKSGYRHRWSFVGAIIQPYNIVPQSFILATYYT
jgi:hypothetical protein